MVDGLSVARRLVVSGVLDANSRQVAIGRIDIAEGSRAFHSKFSHLDRVRSGF